MPELFDSIKGKLEELKAAYQADFGDKLTVSTNEITIIDLPLKTIADFFSKVFGESGDLPSFPLSDATIVRFHAARADQAKGTPTIADIAIGFARNKGVWHVAQGVALALRRADVSYYGGDWSGEIAGSVTVKGVTTHVTLDWPAMIIEGDAAAPPSSALSAFLRDHGLEPAGRGADIAFRFYAAARINYVAIALSAKDLVKVGRFTLKEADLDLVYAGGIVSTFTGSIRSRFDIDRLAFEVDVEKSRTGWKASAVCEAGAASSPKLKDLIASVAAKLGHNHDPAEFGLSGSLAEKRVSGIIKLVFETPKTHARLHAEVHLGRSVLAFDVDVTDAGLIIKATLKLDDMVFDIGFAKETGAVLLAGQFVSQTGLTMSLADLAKAGRLDGGTAPSLGAFKSWNITFRDALFAMHEKGGKTQYMLAADIDGGADLSGLGSLPLVGDLLPHDARLRLSLAPILINKTPWKAAEITKLNDLRGESGPALQGEVKASSLGVTLHVPGLPPKAEALDIKPADVDGSGAAPAGQQADSDITWREIGKSLGPVKIDRVGFALDRSGAEAKVRILMSGALGFGGLDLSLMGLEADYALNSRKVSFGLEGLGLKFEKDPIRLEGAFGNVNGDFLGQILVSLKAVSIDAIGGFTMLGGQPSMFLYGMLNTPLGGPPFFFVEGVAAGFGYNRDFVAPPLSGVRNFPMIEDADSQPAVDHRDKKKLVKDKLRKLHDSIRPELGQYFLAAGVKFSSFELLKSFVILAVGAGRELKIDILGISTYQTPPGPLNGVPALALVKLDLKGAIRPRAGTLLIEAELSPDSYVYSPLCRLGGGFAFASWFSGPHAGDFVISVGGYHPSFDIPAHYPRPSRISLTYKVSDDVFIKGEAYFALTPSVLMAGGGLHAHAETHGVKADGRFSIDFLIGWEPYHYDASAHIDIRAKFLCFHTHAEASLHLWGPDFSGKAHVHWSIISFTIGFGDSKPTVPTIGWDTFKQKFLPKPRVGSCDVLPSVVVSKGEIGKVSAGAKGMVPLVNPKDLEIVVDSFLPFLELSVTGKGGTKTLSVPRPSQDLGCGPVGITKIVSSKMTVAHSIGRNGGPEVTATPETKAFPEALWGQHPVPKPAPGKPIKAKTITAAGRLTLAPKDPVQPSKAATIERKKTAYDEVAGDPSKPVTAFHYKPAAGQAIRNRSQLKAALQSPGASAKAKRAAILSALKLDPATATPRPGLATELLSDEIPCVTGK